MALRYVTYALPLWHGVELSRNLYAGHIDALADLGHLAYLVVVIAAGALLARYSYRRRLARSDAAALSQLAERARRPGALVARTSPSRSGPPPTCGPPG